MPTIMLREYVDRKGHSPYGRWFERLNAIAAARVVTALYRLAEGNFSNAKGVGSGVFELRINFGPGYRVYFGQDGDSVVILLGGSSKKRQREAIAEAQATWDDYRHRRDI